MSFSTGSAPAFPIKDVNKYTGIGGLQVGGTSRNNLLGLVNAIGN